MNIKDDLNNTPFYYAVKHNNINIASYLIKKGADINLKCKNGNTAGHMAFKNQNMFMIGLLLKH